MKKRVVTFLFAFFVLGLLPAVCCEAMPAPTYNLTIQVNTQGQEGLFNFNLKNEIYVYDEATDDYVAAWNNYQTFSLQTDGLIASVLFNDYMQKGLLEQDVAPGFKLNGILCNDSVNDVAFWVSGNKVSFSPWVNSNITCVFSNSKIVEKTPVLIVPGITGTELEKNGELLWADIDRMFVDKDDTFLDPLSFEKDLYPSDLSVVTTNVIKSKTAFDYTDGLIKEFEGQGYVENTNLFTFPYDWRYGVSGKNADGKTNSDLLKAKIAEILNATGAKKVDVVAHSMGGLVVKKYVADNSASHNIGKAIFLGVPNTGSPNAVKALVQGTNFGISFGPVGLSEKEMKKLSENMPGVYDLLPSQKYYDVSGAFVKKIDFSNGLTRPIENDLDYAEFKNYLLNENSMNELAYANAQNLHTNEFDNYDLRTAGVDLYAIDGCKTATMTKFYESTYSWGAKSYNKLNYKIGDGTVPIQSSTNLPIDSAKKFYALNGKHSGLMSQNGSRQQIVNLLAGSNLEVGNNLITQDIGQCKLNGKAIEVFSPLDISVVDGMGNKLGLADGNVTNEINNANFEIWGEEEKGEQHKFVYIPFEGNEDYEINLDGTGAGNYTINVLSFLGGQVVKTESFSNLPVTAELIGQVVLLDNTDGQTTLLIKKDANSEAEIIYPGNYDKTAPVIAVPADVVVETENKSGVVVNYGTATAKDNIDVEVGVLCDIGSNDVFLVGATVVTCGAQDEAGNKAEKSFNVQVNLIAPASSAGGQQTSGSGGWFSFVSPPVVEQAEVIPQVESIPLVEQEVLVQVERVIEEIPKIPEIIVQKIVVAPAVALEENQNQEKENSPIEIAEIGTASLLPISKKYFWWFVGVGILGIAGWGIFYRIKT